MARMSTEAEAALLTAVGRQGAAIDADAKVCAELAGMGLVSLTANLTRKGVTERERVFARRLDEAFG